MKIKTISLLLLAGLLAFSSRAATVITPSYSNSGFTVDTSHDLISGVSPTVSGSTGSTVISSLTDGQAPNSIPGYDGNNLLQNGVVLTWDLGAVTNITEIQSYSAWPGDRYLQDYTVDVSVDGSTWTTGVISVVNQGTGHLGGWNNVKVDVTTDNGAPLAAGVRYVRFNFNNQQNSAVGYTEFVVNGGNPVYKAIATSYSNSGFPVDTAPDMIFGHSPTVSGNTHSTVISSLTDGQAPYSIPGYDGNNVLENGVVLTWDLGAVTNITEIQSYTAWPGDRYLQDYTVDVSVDGSTWTTGVISVVNQGTGHLGGWNNVKVDVTMSDSSPLATGVRYVRFNFNNQQNGAVGYTEFVVNGNGPHTPPAPQAVVTTSYSNSGYSVDNSQDLVYQVLPTSNGHTGTLVLSTLTDGLAPTQIIGYDGNNVIQNGCVLTFDMGAAATVNEIQTYSDWPDGGRVLQDYTVDVSLDGTTWSNGVVSVVNQGTGNSGSWPGVKVAVAMSDSSPLANNVRYIRFNFPSTQNGGVGYQEIVVNGASFALPEAPIFTLKPQNQTTTNGQSVTFTAHATGYPVPAITWHFVDTNSNDTLLSTVGDTLTLPVVDITQNVGHYYAVASNTQGTTNSTPSALLTVIDNGVRQTVNNSGFPFTGLGANYLIQGNAGANLALNNFDTQNGWTPANLTDGDVQGPLAVGNGVGVYSLIGNNATVTYNLGSPCTITGVESWTGWAGGGRDNQNYTFSYSKDGTNFIGLWTVANNPGQAWGNDVSLAIAGLTNVVSVRFNFGTQQNSGVAYNELAVYGTVEVPPVAPVFTVIPQSQTGSNGLSVVTFTAHATGIPTPVITWHFVDTNSTDTLLATVGDTLTFRSYFANAGHYYAVASNLAGTTNSTPSALLTVVPGLVTNEIDLSLSGGSFASLGANDLILGNAGTSALSITTDGDGTGSASVLTDGDLRAPQTGGPLGIQGGTITYNLGSGANGTGYDISGIRSLSAWADGGRMQPKYTVSYSVDGVTFITFWAVNYQPSGVNGADVLLETSGLKNVKYVKFDFSGGQQNGWVSYTELAVYGQASAANASPVPPTLGGAKHDASGFSFSFSGPNGQPYTVLSTTNLTLPLSQWQTNSTGVLTGTNSPISFTNSTPTGSRFYQVRTP